MNKLVAVVLIFGTVVFATLLVSPGMFRKTAVIPQTTWSVRIAESAPSPVWNSRDVAPLLAEPLQNGAKRVTKKTFWTKVSPENSPVSPERFTGYHTGIDFESFDNEQDAVVPVNATCSWPLIYKKNATGYGGVAVQSCALDGKKVTVVYGHLKLSSVTAAVGKKIERWQQIGILWKANSIETWGERKHLHLSVHGGDKLNIMGYVKNSKSLVEWLDPKELLGYDKR